MLLHTSSLKEGLGLRLSCPGKPPLDLAAEVVSSREAVLPERGDSRWQIGVRFSKVDEQVSRCFNSEDYGEGVRAFMEKRAPKFAGR